MEVTSVEKKIKPGYEIGKGENMKDDWNERAKIDAKRYIACPPDQLGGNPDKFWKTIAEACYKDLIEYLPLKGKILEIGCGIGRILETISIKNTSLKICGIDISDIMIEQGMNYLKEFENIKLFTSDGYKLSLFEDNSMDFVFSFQVFQHIPKEVQISYLSEIYRVLKSQKYGMIYIRWDQKVKYYMKTYSGYCFMESEIEKLIFEIGFSRYRILDAPVSKRTGEYPQRRWLVVSK
jgi:ubiquinone/menaquinone biosynthesis C-methylase UbiE